MKIAAAQHIAIFGKNQGIIGYGIKLTFKYVLAVCYSVANRSEHLGSAAQGIGILYPCAILMTTVDLTISYQMAQMDRADLLTPLPTTLVNACIQRNMATHQSLNTHRTSYLGCVYKRLCVGQGQDCHSLQQMGTIDQCQ